jgi:hypothetical protein
LNNFFSKPKKIYMSIVSDYLTNIKFGTNLLRNIIN